MAYYTKVLQPDETVKVIGRLHWSIYLRAAIVLLIALGVLAGSYWLPDPLWQQYALWASAGIASRDSTRSSCGLHSTACRADV